MFEGSVSGFVMGPRGGSSGQNREQTHFLQDFKDNGEKFYCSVKIIRSFGAYTSVEKWSCPHEKDTYWSVSIFTADELKNKLPNVEHIKFENATDRLMYEKAIGIKALSESVVHACGSDCPRNKVKESELDNLRQNLLKEFRDLDEYDFLLKMVPLLISGPTGTGKSTFSRILFSNYLFCRSIDDLNAFDKIKHGGIVFDDVEISPFMSRSDIWRLCRIGCESETIQFTGGRTSNIPKGTKLVMISKHSPEELFNGKLGRIPLLRDFETILILGKMFTDPKNPE